MSDKANKKEPDKNAGVSACALIQLLISNE